MRGRPARIGPDRHDLPAVRQRAGLARLPRGLSGVARAWGAREEACAYVERPNRRFAAANLAAPNLDQMRLNLLMVVHSSRRVVFAAGFDSDRKSMHAPAPGFLRYLADHPDLLGHAGSGLAGLAEGVMIFASSPIAPSGGKGPAVWDTRAGCAFRSPRR